MDEPGSGPHSPANDSLDAGLGSRGAQATGPFQPAARPLTIGQLQRVLQMRLGFTVSENTLERWCRQCKIQAYRLGTAWRIPRDEVERIVKSAQNGESF